MVIPNLFLVGHSKSGTTALFAFLKQHPEIFMSPVKEPNYFAKDLCRPYDAGAFTQRSEAAYRELYAGWSGQPWAGEASACYLYSKVAAAEIAAFNPDARIVFILREPVDFLQSCHLQQLKNIRPEGEKVKDFMKALSLEPERRQGRAVPRGCLIPELLFYSERIRYADQVQRYFDRFDRSQILPLLYDDFRRDNAATYREVLRFLNIDQDFTPAFGEHNKGAKVRSKTAQELMMSLSRGEGIFAPVKPMLKQLLPEATRRRWMQRIYKEVVFESKPTLRDEDQLMLKRRYKPEVERISAVLDRDLVTLWGYNKV